MLINRAEITDHEGVLFYNGEPYFGGIFSLDEETGFLTTHQVALGQVTGPYDNGYIYMDSEPLYLCSEFVDESDWGSTDVITYKGKPYTGFTCDLSKGNKFCEYMEKVVNTVRKDHVMFYPSGKLRGVGWDREDKGWNESYGYFEDESLSGFALYISGGKGHIIDLTLRRFCQISSMWLEPDYFQFIAQHKGEFKCALPFETIEDVDSYSAASRLSLSRPGVTDEFLKHLANNSGLTGLEDISIGSNTLSKKAILSLSNVTTLKKVSINSKEFNGEEQLLEYIALAETFKRQHPECEVNLNSRTVKLSNNSEWYKTYDHLGGKLRQRDS